MKSMGMSLWTLCVAFCQFFRYLPLLISQVFSRQRLKRIPENHIVMKEDNSVLDYNRAISTKLVLTYALALEVIFKSLGKKPGSVIDLAPGPGNLTLGLHKYLGFSPVQGIDLSPTMVKTAKNNAKQQSLDSHVHFRLGNITQTSQLLSNEHILTSLTGTAHHLPNQDALKNVLSEMDRLTREDGLVFVMDMARLRSKALTNRYVKTVGSWYHKEGFHRFYEDFKESMFASWTVEEMRAAIPTDSRRHWFHLVPQGLPLIQIVLGLPVGQKEAFVNHGAPWAESNSLIPTRLQAEWKLFRMMFFLGQKHFIPAHPSIEQTEEYKRAA